MTDRFLARWGLAFLIIGLAGLFLWAGSGDWFNLAIAVMPLMLSVRFAMEVQRRRKPVSDRHFVG